MEFLEQKIQRIISFLLNLDVIEMVFEKISDKCIISKSPLIFGKTNFNIR